MPPPMPPDTRSSADGPPVAARAASPIVLLTTSYPSPAAPVSGVFVAHLAGALARHGPVRVLTPAGRGTKAVTGGPWPAATPVRYAPRALRILAHGPGGIPAALQAHRLAILLVPGLLVSMAWAAWRAAADCRGIIANWSVAGVIGGLVGRLRRRPVIAVLRGEDASRAAAGRSFGWLLRTCIGLCDATVTVSEAMADALRARLPERSARIQCIPNGVSDEFLAIERPLPLGEGVRLLFIGSLIPRKSPMTLVQALARLPATATLTLVGEGSEAAAIVRAIADLGLAGRVSLLPFQGPEHIPRLLAEADLLVLPSRSEGRPNVVLEAFAAALPVVASDIDGCRELIGADERGRLFPVDDVAALAECIRSLSDPRVRHEVGVRGRAFIREQGLDWDSCARRYLQLLADCQTGRGR